MSSDLRQRIGPTNANLKSALAARPKWEEDSNPVPTDQVRDRLRQANFHLTRISRTTEYLEGYDRAWSKLIDNLTGPEREAEAAVFSRFAQDSDYLNTMLNGQAAVALLTSYRDDFADRAATMSATSTSGGGNSAASPGATPSAATQQSPQHNPFTF
jgi:hypothetical protein